MFLSKDTSQALDVLYGSFFDLNATLDRVASVMLNKWGMVQASDIVHHKISHLMPLLADLISEMKDDYNESSIRLPVHEDKRDYDNLLDMFDTVLKEFGDVYEMIKMTDKIAQGNGDLNIHAGMVDFTQKFNKVIGQVITLRDKAEQMPNDYATFDEYSKNWGIVGLELEG